MRVCIDVVTCTYVHGCRSRVHEHVHIHTCTHRRAREPKQRPFPRYTQAYQLPDLFGEDWLNTYYDILRHHSRRSGGCGLDRGNVQNPDLEAAAKRDGGEPDDYRLRVLP